MEIQFPGPAEIILSSTSSFVECFSLEPTRNILNLPTQISKEPKIFYKGIEIDTKNPECQHDWE